MRSFRRCVYVKARDIHYVVFRYLTRAFKKEGFVWRHFVEDCSLNARLSAPFVEEFVNLESHIIDALSKRGPPSQTHE